MKKEELSATARYVKDARSRAKISQEKLGDLIGCGKQNVSGWENDRHSPSPTQLASIVNHTGLPLPEELSPRGIPTPESIRTMPRDQVADSVITGMIEMFRLAGISLDHFIPAEELRQAIVEGRRPEVYSVRQILAATGAARASVASGSFARLAINGTQLENVVMKALTGKEMAKPDEDKPHPDNTPNPSSSVKSKGIRQ